MKNLFYITLIGLFTLTSCQKEEDIFDYESEIASIEAEVQTNAISKAATTTTAVATTTAATTTTETASSTTASETSQTATSTAATSTQATQTNEPAQTETASSTQSTQTNESQEEEEIVCTYSESSSSEQSVSYSSWTGSPNGNVETYTQTRVKSTEVITTIVYTASDSSCASKENAISAATTTQNETRTVENANYFDFTLDFTEDSETENDSDETYAYLEFAGEYVNRDDNQEVQINWSVTRDGESVYSYTDKGYNPTAIDGSFDATLSGKYVFTVDVTHRGVTVEKSISVDVDISQSVEISFDTDTTVDHNTEITFTALATGGAGDYTYNWGYTYVSGGSDVGHGALNNDTYVFTANGNKGGAVVINVNAVDAHGNSTLDTQLVYINAPNNAPEGDIDGAVGVGLNTPFTLTVTASDDDDDDLTYQWGTFGNGNFVAIDGETDTTLNHPGFSDQAYVVGEEREYAVAISDGQDTTYAYHSVEIVGDTDTEVVVTAAISDAVIDAGESATLSYSIEGNSSDVWEVKWHIKRLFNGSQQWESWKTGDTVQFNAAVGTHEGRDFEFRAVITLADDSEHISNTIAFEVNN